MAIDPGFALVAVVYWSLFAFATSEIATSLGWVTFRIGARLYPPAVRPGRARFFDRLFLLFVALIGQVVLIGSLRDPETHLRRPASVWLAVTELLAAAAWILWLASRRRVRRDRPGG